VITHGPLNKKATGSVKPPAAKMCGFTLKRIATTSFFLLLIIEISYCLFLAQKKFLCQQNLNRLLHIISWYVTKNAQDILYEESIETDSKG